MAVGVLFVVFLLLEPGSRTLVLAVDNLAQLGAAVLGCVMCALAARSAPLGRRLPWAFTSVGVGCWAAGQAVWTWLELVRGSEAPFPSAADAGFLAFPVVAGAGLSLWVAYAGTRARAVRDLMDGFVIAGSLLLISWGSALGAVYEAGGGALELSLSLAYPVGDVVMATVAVLAMARVTGTERGTLVLVAAGVLCLAIADSAYVQLESMGGYASGNLISAGWVTGFLLIAAAGWSAVEPAPPTDGPFSVSVPSLLLPYVPVLVAVAFLGWRVERSPGGVSGPEVVLAVLLCGLVLLRQLLVLLDNRALVAALRSREQELAHLAFHDPLTGLANRALFLDRVDQLFAWHQRDGRGLAIMFCDLDDFKDVNDTIGHAAGDVLLVEVADRLRAALRAVDTVARLGGDEFAVLLEQPHDPADVVAQRVVDSIARPVLVDGQSISRTVSVGVACQPPVVPGDVPEKLLTGGEMVAIADRAMYLAKAQGKGQAVVVEVGGRHRIATGASGRGGSSVLVGRARVPDDLR